MESKGWFLQIDQICTYLEATPKSRNFIEGQLLINSKHVISCECIMKTAEMVQIFGLCLQTSGLNLTPHEIKGVLKVKDNKIEIKSVSCSCKAGASEKCKHVAAVLFYCSRNDVSDFKILSQTDIKCTWKTRKGPLLAQYEPSPLLETQCFQEEQKRLKRLQLTAEENNLCLKTFLDVFPNSALGLHSVGRLNNTSSIEEQVENRGEQEEQEEDDLMVFELEKFEFLKEVLNEDSNFFMDYAESVEFSTLQDCCKVSYEKSIVCKDILKVCFATEHDRNRWEKERKFRITGSRCYPIYTYGKTNNMACDWVQKSCKYFWPKKSSKLIKNLEYGIAFEGPARNAYKKEKNAMVMETGLIISQKNPWLAYSPDGVIVENGKITKLLEIKCIVAGRKLTILEAAPKISYLIKENGVYKLKKRHLYYGQVQLGMAILNVKTTDFVVYASVDDSILTIPVSLDEIFLRDMLYTLKKNFFCHMLHNICVNTT